MVVLCEFPGLDLAQLVTSYNMMLCDTVAVTDGARFWCAAITARKAVGFLVTPANIEVILNTGSIGLYPLIDREHLKI